VTQATNTTESYSYDPIGNRLSSLGASPYSVNTSNELTSTPSAAYTYDNNGNTITKVTSAGTTSYGWDYDNRLTSVTLPGTGGTLTFKYDPFGHRIYKQSPNATNIFLYDSDNLVQTVNSTGGLVAHYAQTMNIDEPLAMQRGTTTDYYEADGLGSLTSLTDTTGALAQTYTYDSFGNTTASTGTLRNPFQYAGREFDSETGLYYYRARYYDPSSGRFLSEDPEGFMGGHDFYVYAGNDPVVFIDPWGLQQQGAPVYNPGFWNDPRGTDPGLGYQFWNNCFSYAWNRRFPPQPGKQPRTPQPGDGTKKPLNANPWKLNCESLRASAMASGFKDDAGGGCCPQGYHKVLPFIGQHPHQPGGPDFGQPDYHWYRQDSNGQWSSKHGQQPVGPQVPDPNKDAAAWGYDTPCGAMCAPN
jgi:RHS repeat-associated protein